MKTTRVKLIALAVSVFTSVATLQAALITGSLWEGTDGIGAPANIPARPADVTFSVDSPLNFNSNLGGYTIGGWLGSGGATILTGADHANNTINWTTVQFIGMVSVVNGQQFTVVHDDGLTLIIGGVTVVNEPGPTAPITTTRTYTGPTGNFPFQLVYGEGWGAPAVLQVDLPFTPVPEPSTVIAGALLLLPFAASTMRFMRKNRKA